MTSVALAQPAITQTGVDPAKWRLDEDLVVWSRGYQLVVHAGFVTDLASIPRALWWLIAPFELSCAAPIVHDWLYSIAGRTQAVTVSRADADAILYDVAAQEGVWWWRRWLAYKAVRWFGARDWGKP